MSVTSSPEVFFTETVKVNVPPGSSIEVGLAVLVTSIVGATSVIVTSAVSKSVAVVSSSSVTTALTRSVATSPALPETAPVKVQV